MITLREFWRSFRKFSLEYCDLPIMLDNVAILLRVLTVNIDSKYHKGITVASYIVTAVSAVCYYYVFLLSMAWFVFWRCRITGEMVPAMVVLSLGISSEIGTCKLLYMRFHIDQVKKIADDYLECDSHTVHGSRFHGNLLKYLKDVKRRAMVYWIVVTGNGVLYITYPLLLSGRNLPENYFVIYGLEPMFDTPNFQIAYCLMVCAMFFICYVPATVTAYLIVITGYTESQMRALSEEMVQLWPDAVKYAESVEEQPLSNSILENKANNNKVINQFLTRRLKDLVARHAININLLHQVEQLFRVAIAVGFVLLVLGLLAELLGKLENTYLQMPFVIMQVSMDCFVGQRVMDASILFERAVYDCKWENFDKTNMKMVLIMLQSAQKTMTLSAGGITMLSFTSLMTVMRGIYSAYTTLRSTVE